MNTKIFVMTHKKFDEPQDGIYIPLQVGKSGNTDLGYMGDDTGISISEKNCYYGELTGLYWLWKNYHDVDIIGICHYRRYFVNEDRTMMTQADYEAVMEQYDMLVSNEMDAGEPYLDYFGKAHNREDMVKAGEVIRELYPDDYEAFTQVMQEASYYYGNLCVTKKQIFDDYCAWLFGIFEELEKRVDVSGYDTYHQRLYGFLSEELLRVYIRAKGLNVKAGNIGITEEKAETVEFKLAMTQLVKLGNFTEAREMFYEYLKIRPDIRLELSDIRREIPDIELILYILEQEKRAGTESFYAVSHFLPDLIVHIRNIRVIVRKQQAGETLSQQERDYLEKTKPTELAMEIIRIN